MFVAYYYMWSDHWSWWEALKSQGIAGQMSWENKCFIHWSICLNQRKATGAWRQSANKQTCARHTSDVISCATATCV